MIVIALTILVIVIAIVLLKDRKDLKRRTQKYKTTTKHYILDSQDPELIKEYIQAYDEQILVREEYNYRTKRLTDEFYGEKVDRYRPAYLPFKIEGNEVYSYRTKNVWEKVGEFSGELLDKTDLLLNMNQYKEVRNIKIEKVKGEPYFEIVTTRSVKL